MNPNESGIMIENTDLIDSSVGGADPVRIGGLSGILAGICFIVGYSIAWAMSPWYVFGGHYLSDLGVGEGALAFNMGAISAGLILIPFAWGLWSVLRTHVLGELGSLACAVAGIFLFLVGVFPEHAEPEGIHYAVSVSFFSFIMAALMLLIWPLSRSPPFSRLAAPLTLIVVILSAAVAVTFKEGPLIETIAVLQIIVWGFVVSLQMVISTRSERAAEQSLEELG